MRVIGGRDQPNLVAKLGQLTRPVMCSTACLFRSLATRLRRAEIEQLSSANPLAQYCSTTLVRSVNVKNVLGDIETDYANLRHGRLPLSGAQHIHFGTSMPSAGRPPHHKSCLLSGANRTWRRAALKVCK